MRGDFSPHLFFVNGKVFLYQRDDVGIVPYKAHFQLSLDKPPDIR